MDLRKCWSLCLVVGLTIELEVTLLCSPAVLGWRIFSVTQCKTLGTTFGWECGTHPHSHPHPHPYPLPTLRLPALSWWCRCCKEVVRAAGWQDLEPILGATFLKDISQIEPLMLFYSLLYAPKFLQQYRMLFFLFIKV